MSWKMNWIKKEVTVMNNKRRDFMESSNRELADGNTVILRFRGLRPEFTSDNAMVYVLGRPDAVNAYVPGEFGFKDRDADNILLSEPQGVRIGDEPIELRRFNMPLSGFEEAYEWLLNTFGMEDGEIEESIPAQDKPARAEKKRKMGHQWYLTDLTQLAKEGKLPRIIGRKNEMDKVCLILSRKDRQNPVLVGETGVGKDAIGKGVAHRVAQGDVPDGFQITRIIQVDLGGMLRDTEAKVEAEKRFMELMDLAGVRDVLLYMNHINMLADERVSAPFPELLKASIIKGELKVMGTATSLQYKGMEDDTDFEKRLTKVMILEPTPEETMEILQGIRADYEGYHRIAIDDSALEDIIPLAERAMPHRRFPDKAIEILDTCLALCRKYGHPVATRMHLMEALEKLTGIPVEKLGADSSRMGELDGFLMKRIMGQDEAITAVANGLKVKYAGLTNGRPPTFLFTGPSGVGKTETARCTAEFIFGSPESLIRIDMSEFMDSHTVARLIGAPPSQVDEPGGTVIGGSQRLPVLYS